MKYASPSRTQVDAYTRQFLRRIRSGECNKDGVHKAVCELYCLLGLEPPEVVWCENPVQLTNFPWLFSVFLSGGNAAWRADMLKRFTGSSKRSKNPSTEEVWKRMRGYLKAGLHERDQTGAVLTGEITRNVLLKLISSLSDQAEKQLGWSSKYEIDQRVSRTLVGETRHLNAVCEQLGRQICVSEMKYEPAVYAPPGRDWVKSEDKHDEIGLRPRNISWITISSSDFGSLLAFDCMRRHHDDDHVGIARKPLFHAYDNTVLDLFIQFSQNASSYIFMERFCFVCMYPAVQFVDETGRFHCSDGPAVQFRDGQKLYFWRGSEIDKNLIERKKMLTPLLIDLQPNIETRRIMLEIYGFEKYLRKSRAKKIHHDECGTLYRKSMLLEEAIVAVEVTNSTPEPDGTHKRYLLRVPPTTRTAREAVAWTFGLAEQDYRPDKQT